MKIDLTKEDFETHLARQIEFLKNSIFYFDNGFKDECIRIAQVVRVLLHDTGNSTSLLTHLGKKNVAFHDTSFPFDSRNQQSHSSLVRVGIGNGPSVAVPLLDDGPFQRQENFDTWWNGVVFVDQSGSQFSRKDMVLTLADKEGGAHIDPSLDEAYVNLRKNNSLGWFDQLPSGKSLPSADQVPATVRQIAHEVLKTLVPNYSLNSASAYPNYRPGVWAAGMSVVEGSTPHPIPSQNPRKAVPTTSDVKTSRLGRNKPCPCGSGKKYKKCCGKTNSR